MVERANYGKLVDVLEPPDLIEIIENGNKIVIWERSILQKDINDLFLAGFDIMSILKSNTYSGLEAKVKFNEWKRV